MAMTKKHYEIVAGALYKEFLDLGGVKTQYNYGRVDGWRNIVYKLAVDFENNDTKFNKEKFLKECGL